MPRSARVPPAGGAVAAEALAPLGPSLQVLDGQEACFLTSPRPHPHCTCSGHVLLPEPIGVARRMLCSAQSGVGPWTTDLKWTRGIGGSQGGGGGGGCWEPLGAQMLGSQTKISSPTSKTPQEWKCHRCFCEVHIREIKSHQVNRQGTGSGSIKHHSSRKQQPETPAGGPHFKRASSLTGLSMM